MKGWRGRRLLAFVASVGMLFSIWSGAGTALAAGEAIPNETDVEMYDFGECGAAEHDKDCPAGKKGIISPQNITGFIWYYNEGGAVPNEFEVGGKVPQEEIGSAGLAASSSLMEKRILWKFRLSGYAQTITQVPILTSIPSILFGTLRCMYWMRRCTVGYSICPGADRAVRGMKICGWMQMAIRLLWWKTQT